MTIHINFMTSYMVFNCIFHSVMFFSINNVLVYSVLNVKCLIILCNWILWIMLSVCFFLVSLLSPSPSALTLLCFIFFCFVALHNHAAPDGRQEDKGLLSCSPPLLCAEHGTWSCPWSLNEARLYPEPDPWIQISHVSFSVVLIYWGCTIIVTIQYQYKPILGFLNIALVWLGRCWKLWKLVSATEQKG